MRFGDSFGQRRECGVCRGVVVESAERESLSESLNEWNGSKLWRN